MELDDLPPCPRAGQVSPVAGWSPSPPAGRAGWRRRTVRRGTDIAHAKARRQFELGFNVEPRTTRLVGMMQEGAAFGDPRTWSSSRRAAASPISRIGWRTVV